MAYDHGNRDYSYGWLPKTHFSEKWYNVRNSCTMKPIERPKDRRGYDRPKFTPKRKMPPYGKGVKYGSKSSTTAMRRRCLSAQKKSMRFRLKTEMLEMLCETLVCAAGGNFVTGKSWFSRPLFYPVT